MRTRTKLLVFFGVMGGVFFILLRSSQKPWGRSAIYAIDRTYRPDPVNPEDLRTYRAVLRVPPEERRFGDIEVPETVFRLASSGDKVDFSYRSIPIFHLEAVSFHWTVGQIDESWGRGEITFWAGLVATAFGLSIISVILSVVVASIMGLRPELQ